MTNNGHSSSRSLDRILLISAIAALVVTAASYAGKAWWAFELFGHFRLQIAAGSLLILVCAAIRRQRAVAVAASLAAVCNIVPVWPYLWPAPPETIAGTGRYRLLICNVGKSNVEYQRLVDLIEREDADVVGLLEVDQTWVESLSASGSSANYDFQVLRPEEGAYGIALYSRLPVRETGASPYRRSGFQAAIVVELELPAATVNFALAHLMAPLGRTYAQLRNEQLADIVDLLHSSSNKDSILAGDLNITPWSPHYSALETGTGMVNAARGTGYRGTWPAWFAPIRIPIDHYLLSAGFQVARIRTGPDIGSDHLPLIVDIVVADNAHRVNSAK